MGGPLLGITPAAKKSCKKIHFLLTRLAFFIAEIKSLWQILTSLIGALFPFGWGELWGIADRTDYDLTQHQNVSGEPMEYFDDEKGQKYVPYVVEPSLGADRVTLAFLCAAYDEEELEGGDVRTVLHFHPALAPVKIGILPLSKKLNEGAEKIYAELSKKYNCEFDDRGNIGKRYRRQDEIGTPFCITYDFESENDGCVTVRDRDTMAQERIKIEDLKAYFEVKFEWQKYDYGEGFAIMQVPLCVFQKVDA